MHHSYKAGTVGDERRQRYKYINIRNINHPILGQSKETQKVNKDEKN